VQVQAAVAVTPYQPSIYNRHQFLLKRLLSLLGLFFGGYTIVHLLTNSFLLGGPAAFQASVDRIHALGPALPVVEWTFLFIPILFHSLVGWVVIFGASPNLGDYPLVGNIRYVLQRVTAIILFFFIAIHVWQMHHLGARIGGGQFDAERAASSVGVVFQSALWVPLFYALGVLSAAFHLGNGIWTAGITWGLWSSPAAQRRANYIAVAIGVLVMISGVGAIAGARGVNVEQARVVEDRMERARAMLNGEEVGSSTASEHVAK